MTRLSLTVSHPMPTQRLAAAARRAIPGFVCLLLTAIAARGEVPDALMQRDGWGRFRPGAWQEVRVVTETLDAEGKVLSTTTSEQLTTLVSVRGDRVRLQVETSAEVAGKRIDAPLREISQGCHGEEVGEEITVNELGAGTATIEGRSVPCRIRQYRIADKEARRLVTVHYSSDVSPYLLKREIVATSADGQREIMRLTSNVVAVNIPRQVLKRVMPAAQLRTEQRSERASVSTVSVLVPEIPGGIVASTTQELDAEGRLVRRSTLELLDYGLQSDVDDDGHPTGRRAARRARRGK